MAQAATKDNFEAEVLNTQEVVLIDFWAPWCGPCQMLTPIIDELAEEIGEGAKIMKVNVDEEAELAAEYGVMSIPALKVFRDGEVVDEAVGVKSKEDLVAMVERNK